MPFFDTPETNALKSKVEKLLSEIPDFTDENKNLKINVIKDYADNGNAKLLEPLLKNPQTKKAFFTPVLDSFVFNTAKFKEFLEYSSACNSYSKDDLYSALDEIMARLSVIEQSTNEKPKDDMPKDDDNQKDETAEEVTWWNLREGAANDEGLHRG